MSLEVVAGACIWASRCCQMPGNWLSPGFTFIELGTPTIAALSFIGFCAFYIFA